MKLKTALFTLFKIILSMVRGVFRTLAKIYDGALVKVFNIFKLLTIFANVSIFDARWDIFKKMKTVCSASISWYSSLSIEILNDKISITIFHIIISITSITEYISTLKLYCIHRKNLFYLQRLLQFLLF